MGGDFGFGTFSIQCAARHLCFRSAASFERPGQTGRYTCFPLLSEKILGVYPVCPWFSVLSQFWGALQVQFTRRSTDSSALLPVWLIIIAIHFDWPKQMRERELGELPLAVFLDIHLSHHKRIGDFVLTDYCLQINVL